jgi:hypothetical protein
MTVQRRDLQSDRVRRDGDKEPIPAARLHEHGVLGIGSLGLSVLAAVLLGCGQAASQSAPSELLVTAHADAAYALALIGPLSLDIETVSGTRCFMVKATSESPHGVVWPYGTKVSGDSLIVPGLTDPLRSGETFWAGGGSGDSEASLGPCNKAPVYYLGPTASRTNPQAAPQSS